VFEAGEGQTEVIEALVEKLAGDGDCEIGDLGEVGQPHAAGRMLLAENHLAIRAVHRPPGPDASLQGSPHSREKPGMSAQQLVENADRPQSGRGFQQRQDFAFPNAGERIGPPPFARRLFLAGKPGLSRTGRRLTR